MSAPNRLPEIDAIWNQYHLQPITDDTLRFNNLKVIIRELNKIDGGNWGFLKKNDQNGKIPTDVLCWRPTMEIFDVLLGTTGEPFWNPLGAVTNPNWVWEAYIPEGGEEPPPVDSTIEELLLSIKNSIEKIADIESAIIEGLDIMSSKMGELQRDVNTLKDKAIEFPTYDISTIFGRLTANPRK